MTATGDILHGWRVHQSVHRRTVFGGEGRLHLRFVSHPIVELVKGQRHVRAEGQDGIDPQIVLDQALTRALEDDLREARLTGEPARIAALTTTLAAHQRQADVRRNALAARRVLTRRGLPGIFRAGTARGRGGIHGDEQHRQLHD